MTQYASMSGSNGNANPSTTGGILNEVWDEAGMALRVETAYSPSVNISQPYAATANGAGNYNGTGNPQTLFTITGGNVLLAIMAVCTTTLTGTSATIEVGNATVATRYLPQITATNFTVGKSWDITGIISAGTAPNITPNQVAISGEAIIATVGTANITAGGITYYAFWRALTPGASVVASAPITA